MGRTKAIAWDMDGTIVKFNIDFIQARRKTIDILIENGADASKLSMNRSILENVGIARKLLGEMGVPEENINKIIKLVDESVVEIEAEAAISAKIVEGIPEVLRYCHQIGIIQIIYTLNTHLNAENTLRNVNILEFFNLIVGRDDVPNPKPHPDHLNYIFNKLNIKKEELLVIGDNPRDIQGANYIGSPSIGILTKRHLKRDLKGAKLIIRQEEIPQNLLEVIKSFL